MLQHTNSIWLIWFHPTIVIKADIQLLMPPWGRSNFIFLPKCVVWFVKWHYAIWLWHLKSKYGVCSCISLCCATIVVFVCCVCVHVHTCVYNCVSVYNLACIFACMYETMSACGVLYNHTQSNIFAPIIFQNLYMVQQVLCISNHDLSTNWKQTSAGPTYHFTSHIRPQSNICYDYLSSSTFPWPPFH